MTADEQPRSADLAEVSIDTPPLSVTVRGAGSVDELAAAALALYRSVFTPGMAGVAPPAGGLGFVVIERGPGGD